MAQQAMLTERYNVSFLDLKSGLPHNNISSVFVDSNGFLWVATYGGGLVRYDGYGMTSPKLRLGATHARALPKTASNGSGWLSTRAQTS